MALFNDVESLLEPSACNPPRNSCRRVNRNYWHDPAEHRSNPEFTDVACNSMDACCNRRVASIFLVVCERTRVAEQHARSPTARLACTVAVEARVDMGADCGNTGDYRHDRDGVRDGTSGASASGGICCANGFLKVWNANRDLRDRLY